MTVPSFPPQPRGFLELAIRRLNAHRPISEADQAAVRGLRGPRRLVRPGDMAVEPGQLHLVLDGWACLAMRLPDGRRQILDLVLPGDPISHPPDTQAMVPFLAWEALTPLVLADADPLSEIVGIHAAVSINERAQNARRCGQILRLGVLTAQERIAHFLLELHLRQTEIGLTHGDRFPCPLRQHTIGAVLGLTSAHVNRTFRQMKADGHLAVGRDWIALPGHAALARQLEFRK